MQASDRGNHPHSQLLETQPKMKVEPFNRSTQTLYSAHVTGHSPQHTESASVQCSQCHTTTSLTGTPHVGTPSAFNCAVVIPKVS